MLLKSSGFKQGGRIPKKFTCEGENISFPFEVDHVPPQAKSLALIMDDPDVPDWVRKDRLWVHWVVYNIEPTTVKVEEDADPFGTQGKNTSGELGYMGPCPPDREHRYFLKLYALDKKLDLQEGATKEELMKAMQGHILAETELMGLYEKGKK